MILRWINDKYRTNFTEQELNHVKDFALIWNIFEAKVCNTRCNIPNMKKAFEKKEFQLNDFEETLNYFKQRYINDGVSNERFGFLHIREPHWQQFVIEVLTEQRKDIRQIVLAIAIIVYRFRNNLFHGQKNIATINEQNENFSRSNLFLQQVLNYFM